MRWAAGAVVVVAACSFEHGAAPTSGDGSTSGDGACTIEHRYAITTTAPTGYTAELDISQLGANANEVRVLVDDETEIDRVIEDGRLFFKVPPEGSLALYVGRVATKTDATHVFMFAESFDDAAAMTRFDLQPPADWSVTTEHLLHVAGALRHPGQIKNLVLADGEIRARIRVGAATGQQHNGVAARGNSMAPISMDGFVTQLQADLQHARIAEYTDGASPPAELITMDRTVARGVWYALQMRFVGDAITFSIDGAPALAATKSGSDGQLVGIFAHDCEVDFDDVRVRPAMNPEPIVTLGSDESRCD